MSRQITLKLYSLAERMPAVDTDVLVFDSEDPTGLIGAYVGDDDDGPMWVNSHGMPIFNVTDWADLPSRADAQEAPAGLTDGRGTDVQIERERDIARHAIVGALAAGYAGASHPGDAHWLAAAHDAGMRIKSLEDAAQPTPVPPAVPDFDSLPDDAIDAAFAKRCYVMSEPHLSGARLIIGFEHLEDASDAHMALAGTPRPAPAQRMTLEQMRAVLTSAGYDDATVQARADFINGARHAEVHHRIGITANASGVN